MFFFNIIALIITLWVLWGTIKLFIFLIKLPFRIIKNSSHSTSSTKNPVSKSFGYKRKDGYKDNIKFPVFKVDNTNFFLENLKNMNIDKIGTYVAKFTENKQILGAYVIHNKYSQGVNKKIIYEKIITRNQSLRQSVYVPGYNKVRYISKDVGEESYRVYERTHLISFRHSLQEGECGNLLITGTAKLNQGRDYEKSIIPTDSDKKQIQEYLIKTFKNNNYKIKLKNKCFNQIPISLDDTERFYDFLLNTQFHYEKGIRIPDLLKYSVECKYLKEDHLIPHHVIVRISNLTRNNHLAYFEINNY